MTQGLKFLFLALYLFLAACGSQGEDRNSLKDTPLQMTQGIVGGSEELDTADSGYWSIAQLEIRKSLLVEKPPGHSQRRINLDVLCTGTLISENLVVTAAHCVRVSASELKKKEKPLEKTKLQMRVYFPQIDEERAVEKLWVHPNYKEEARTLEDGSTSFFPIHDLALLKLSSSIEKPLSPILMGTPTNSALKVRLYGFGLTQLPNPWAATEGGKVFIPRNDSGVLRYVDTQAQVMQEPSLLYLDQTSGKGFCEGDSGGPLFSRDKEPSLVGVVSYSYWGSQPEMKDLCQTQGYATLLSPYISWIESFL